LIVPGFTKQNTTVFSKTDKLNLEGDLSVVGVSNSKPVNQLDNMMR